MNYYALGQEQAFVKLGLTGPYVARTINKFRQARGLAPASLGAKATALDRARQGTEGIATVGKSNARMGLLHEANSARAGEASKLMDASPANMYDDMNIARNTAYAKATGLNKKVDGVLSRDSYYTRGGHTRTNKLPPDQPPGLGHGIVPGVNPRGQINQAAEAARRQIYGVRPPVRENANGIIDPWSRHNIERLADGLTAQGSVRGPAVTAEQIALRNM